MPQGWSLCTISNFGDSRNCIRYRLRGGSWEEEEGNGKKGVAGDEH
jgi:hypothetical protein